MAFYEQFRKIGNVAQPGLAEHGIFQFNIKSSKQTLLFYFFEDRNSNKFSPNLNTKLYFSMTTYPNIPTHIESTIYFLFCFTLSIYTDNNENKHSMPGWTMQMLTILNINEINLHIIFGQCFIVIVIYTHTHIITLSSTQEHLIFKNQLSNRCTLYAICLHFMCV